MARTLTADEVEKRIDILEAKDREPGLTWNELAEQFSTSKRVVGKAMSKTVDEWLDVLDAIEANNEGNIVYPRVTVETPIEPRSCRSIPIPIQR